MERAIQQKTIEKQEKREKIENTRARARSQQSGETERQGSRETESHIHCVVSTSCYSFHSFSVFVSLSSQRERLAAL
jgi:hypothetical protein